MNAKMSDERLAQIAAQAPNDHYTLERQQLALELVSAREEIERLQTALYRIALKDRHYRLHKPKADGGLRGTGSMIATFALMGVNGSYISDAAITERYPHIAAALAKATTP